MTDATLSRDDSKTRAAKAKAAALVQVSPESDLPETRDKRSGGRGLLIGLGLAGLFWAGVAAAVVALTN